MAKRVAEEIVNILIDDDNNLKKLYKEYDWKQCIIDDVKHAIKKKKSNIPILKYVKMIKNLEDLLFHRLVSYSNDYYNSLKDTSKIDDHTVIFTLTDKHRFKIIDQDLQCVVDFCISLDLKIKCSTVYDQVACAYWDHWEK